MDASTRTPFRAAMLASAGLLAATIAVTIAMSAVTDAPGPVAVLGGLAAAFIAAATVAASWGGRPAVLGVVAGFLAPIAAITLVVAVCALVVFGVRGL